METLGSKKKFFKKFDILMVFRRIIRLFEDDLLYS